jgi:hypothetical protein
MENILMTELRNIIITEPVDSHTGGVEVAVQDQSTEPVDAYFNRSLDTFTLAADTTASTEFTLNYTFTSSDADNMTDPDNASAAHPLAAGDEVLFLDIANDREFQATIIQRTGAGDPYTYTIDRPFDHVFEFSGANTALCRWVTSNMARAAGSLTTPLIYTFRAGTDPVDVTRLFLTMYTSSTSTANDGQFGTLSALTNGLVFRIFNGLHKTVFNFKKNLDIKQMCYDLAYGGVSQNSATGVVARISFGSQSKHGVVLRQSNTDRLQWVVQDDLTAMDSVQASCQGHHTTT